MRPYEVMVIFDAAVEPPDIQAVLDRALESVRSTGGNPGSVDRWGKRTFAYEVNHKREGYYVLVEFTAGPQTVADLDRLLGLADEVVRHKIIRLPEGVAGRRPTPGPGGRPKGGPGAKPAPAAPPAETAEAAAAPETEEAGTDTVEAAAPAAG